VSTRQALWLVVFGLAGLLFAAVTAQAQTTYYVDGAASASGDGSEWIEAFQTIQEALDEGPIAGDFILVAGGTYKPSAANLPFTLVTGVSTQGKFVGQSGLLTNTQNNRTEESILTGDLDGNGPDTGDAAIVVKAPANLDPPTQSGPFANQASLDGFTITAGHNPSSFPSIGQGAGIVAESDSEAVIRDCIIHNNTATEGAGIYVVSTATLTLRKCEIHTNIAENAGGGMYVQGSAILLDCNIHDNIISGESHADTGAGIHFQSETIENEKLILVSCTLAENHSADVGGGIYAEIEGEDAVLELLNCLVVGHR
jgi:hypothetical protein